jgi:CzcA family heavy metal efflux pump
MLTRIVNLSLHFRGVVIAIAALVAGYGVYSVATARNDVFPEFASKQIEIQTEAPGFSPGQVEVLVTQPIENAMNGSEGLVSMRSASVQGLSLVTLVFEGTGDVYHVRQIVAERVAGVGSSLPAGVSAPAMTPLTSSTGDLMTIGLTSNRLSPKELRSLADWTIKPRLLAVPGLAKIGVYGGSVRELRVDVDPAALVRLSIGFDEVIAAATRATGVSGAGFVDTPNQRIVLQAVQPPATAESIAATVVRHDAIANIRIADVAQVVDGAAPAISAATVMGKPAVVMNLWTQYGANTVETTDGVDAAIDELRPMLAREGVTIDATLFRAANFIETSTKNIEHSLLIGGFLVIVILFLFLGHARAAAISCAAIPLSLLTAVIVMQKLGFTLNTMTLGGLAIAIGEVVDDAVIDIENILRRLRERGPGLGVRERLQIILDASIEVRSAVVYATLSVIAVFFPILTMSGLSGKLFAPMALAYIFAILASLVVALTVTPALALMLTRSHEVDEPPRWVTRLREHYATLLGRVEMRSKVVIAVCSILTAAGLVVIFILPTEFLPELREGHYLAHMELAVGSSIAESTRVGNIATARLLKLPFVRSVAQRVGRAESDDVFGPQSSELEIDLHPVSGETARTAGEQIAETLDAIPGATFEVETFLTERINETISGYTTPVVANVFGNDLAAIDEKSAEIAAMLEKLPGSAGVQIESPPGGPLLAIHLRPEALQRWGIDNQTAVDAVSGAYDGVIAGETFEGARVTGIRVAIAESLRQSPSDVARLPVRTPSGSYVRLADIADISMTTGRSEILHEGAKRVQTITCNVQGVSAAEFVKRARAEVAKLGVRQPQLPLSDVHAPHEDTKAAAAAAALQEDDGTFVQFAGSAQEESKARRDLLLHSLTAAVGIALLLWVVLGNGRNLALVATNLPFALVGGVLALAVTRMPLSIGATVGFVTLFGITLRNAIMMLSHYEHLVTREGAEWNLETAIRGASERLVPILMTSIVTAFGLLPLALSADSPGREIEGPMAIVILGGLATSTLLNLLVLPTLALRFGRFSQ